MKANYLVSSSLDPAVQILFKLSNFLETEYGWWRIYRTNWSALNFLFVDKMNLWVGLWYISISEPYFSIWEEEGWNCISIETVPYQKLIISIFHPLSISLIQIWYQPFIRRREEGSDFNCVSSVVPWQSEARSRGWNGAAGETGVLCF